YRRWLKDYAKHNAHVICLARKGMKAYVDQYGPYGTRDDSLLEVGQCLVADGKTLNFFIRHPVTGRPCRMKLIVFMDWKSRYPVGWQIMPEEDSIAILAAFRNAVATLGKYPESVYLDNGKAFKAKVFTETDPDLGDLVGLYARVGTATLFADPYSGRSKAVVERWFRTVQMQMEVLIPSYCGDSISTKPAWMHRNEKFHKAWHDAKTRGWIPNIREAAFLLEHYFNWYAQQPQKTLGTTPETLFLQGKGPGVDPLQLNHDFTWRTQAQPRNCRIRLWNIEYEGDCLHGLSRKEKIQIRYNTADMRVIWCYTQEGIYIGEVYPVEALHPLARLFGDEVSMAQVKDHNKRLARHKKHTVRHLKALGVGRDAVDSLGVLPFAAKVPVIPEGTPERPKPLPKAEELSTQDIKQLEAKVQAAEKEMQQKQDIPRPQYWASDLEHYEWCFSVIYQHGQSLNQEDEQFMDEFEALPEFEHYRQRFEDLKTLYE
ncbi:MAG: DDE-type integrase/transposase/recombinase, partial [Desulfovibrionales bacterium]|nr:DDE-type integrase/transposase/recombinase [Desulfovibrionales bacterium]